MELLRPYYYTLYLQLLRHLIISQMVLKILIFIDFPPLTRSKKTISPLELIISVQESSLYSIIKI